MRGIKLDQTDSFCFNVADIEIVHEGQHFYSKTFIQSNVTN